ncbi:MAG: hypothetical protein R3229_08370 [Alphaproteobacteria bacterium]|nr:hypothetical protein [Alphaproteobacteria bacterium]
MKLSASSLWQGLKTHWKLALAVIVLIAVSATGALAYVSGILTIERHRGFFAPVWSEDGASVYYVERSTRGLIWGFGWEFFTPPARAYVLSDRFGLRRVGMWDGKIERLADFDKDSPLVGRTTKHYRGRIFNTLSARLTPGPGGLAFRIRMQVPKVPGAEHWSLAGLWRSDRAAEAAWERKWTSHVGVGEEVLKNGFELIAIKGVESYPAAILAVDAGGDYRVLVKNARFRRLYPQGVPRRLIQQVSRRKAIERSRMLRRVQAELMAKYLAEGDNDGTARLKTHDEMERLGYYPKSPRLIARLVEIPPDGVRVFTIPAQRFRVGLYQDIARAIAKPGAEVKTDTGTYLKYADDVTGPELKAWREAGNDRFAVRTEGKLYLMEVRRFEREPKAEDGAR